MAFFQLNGHDRFLLTYATLIVLFVLNLVTQHLPSKKVEMNVLEVAIISVLTFATISPRELILSIRGAKTVPMENSNYSSENKYTTAKHKGSTKKGAKFLLGNQFGDLRNTLRSGHNATTDVATDSTLSTFDTQSKGSLDPFDFEGNELSSILQEGRNIDGIDVIDDAIAPDGFRSDLSHATSSEDQAPALVKDNVHDNSPAIESDMTKNTSASIPPSDTSPSSEGLLYRKRTNSPLSVSANLDLDTIVLPTGLKYDHMYKGYSPDPYTHAEVDKLDTACVLLDTVRKAALVRVRSSNSKQTGPTTMQLYQTVDDIAPIFTQLKHRWYQTKPPSLHIGTVYIKAPPSHVLAFLLDYMNPRRREFNKDDIVRFISSRSSSHTMSTFNRRWMPVPFLYRDIYTKHTWKRLDANRIIYCTYSVDDEPYPPPQMENESKGVRPFFFTAVLIENSASDEKSHVPDFFQNSIVSIIIDIDAGGSIPSHLRQYACLRAMTVLSDIETYFQTTGDAVEKVREDYRARRNILHKYRHLGATKLLFNNDNDDQVPGEEGTYFSDWLSTAAPWADPEHPTAKIFSGTIHHPMLTLDEVNREPHFESDLAEMQFEVFTVHSWVETFPKTSKSANGLLFISAVLFLVTIVLDRDRDQHSNGTVSLFMMLYLLFGFLPIYLMRKAAMHIDFVEKDKDYHTNIIKTCTSASFLVLFPGVLLMSMLAYLRPAQKEHELGGLGLFPLIFIFIVIATIFAALPCVATRSISKIFVFLVFLLVPQYSTLMQDSLSDEESYERFVLFFQQMTFAILFTFSLFKSASKRSTKARELFSLYWLEYKNKFIHEKATNRKDSSVGNDDLNEVLRQLDDPQVQRQLASLLEVQVEYKELKYLHEVGKGGNGVVFAATYRNQIVAVKELMGETRLNESNVMSFIGEMQFGVMLRHKNIVRTIGCVLKSPHICCILEYAKEGSLKDVMRKESLLDWSNGKQSFALDICHGMRYLHERKRPIIHRDLKTANVLITDWRSAKISDFGSSRLLPDNLDELTMDVGTAIYMAPEVLRGDAYGTSSDVYNFGCILVDLAMHGNARTMFYSGENPPNNQIDLTERVARGWRPKLPRKWKNLIPVVAKLINDCWSQDPVDRPSFKKIEKLLSAWDGDIHMDNKDLNNAVAHASVYSLKEETVIKEGYQYIVEGLGKVKAMNRKQNNSSPGLQKSSGMENNNFEVSLDVEYSQVGFLGVQSRVIPYSAPTVANYVVQFDHPFRKIINVVEGSERFRTTIHRENEHHSIIQVVKILPPPLKNREFVLRQIWKRISQGTYLIHAEDAQYDADPERHAGDPHFVRAKCRFAFLIQDIPGTNSCRVTNRFNVKDLWGKQKKFLPQILGSLTGQRESIAHFLWEIEAFLNKERKGLDSCLTLHPSGFSSEKYNTIFDKAFEEYVTTIPEDQRFAERYEISEKEEEDSMSGRYFVSFEEQAKDENIDKTFTSYVKSWVNATPGETRTDLYNLADESTNDRASSETEVPGTNGQEEDEEGKIPIGNNMLLDDDKPWAKPSTERRRIRAQSFDEQEFKTNVEGTKLAVHANEDHVHKGELAVVEDNNEEPKSNVKGDDLV